MLGTHTEESDSTVLCRLLTTRVIVVAADCSRKRRLPMLHDCVRILAPLLPR